MADIVDSDDIHPVSDMIITHSKLYSFLRCPRQFMYRYEESLVPARKTRTEQPLERGTWFHKLLEEHYAGRSWVCAHAHLTRAYNALSHEEQFELGDLPDEMYRLMHAYLWHYAAEVDDGWKVHEAELMLECPWPGGGTYRGKIDLLIEDQRGLWIVDHKTMKTLPNTRYRVLDKASVLYVWAARQVGIPVNGFIWNYIVPKAPTVPKVLKDGKRLSKIAISTDYPTMLAAVKQHGLNPADYADQLDGLKSVRWSYGSVQRSDFFRRDVMVKDEDLEKRVLESAVRTTDRMVNYSYDDTTERVVERACDWCSFGELCSTDLTAGMDSQPAQNLRSQRYRVVDPFAYYEKDNDGQA